MTNIVPTPAAPIVPQYPALGSANFNTEAYAYGSSMPAVSYRIWEIGVAAETNSAIAKSSAETAVEKAYEAGQSEAQALQYKEAAETANTAVQAAAPQALSARDVAVQAAAAAQASAEYAAEVAESIQEGPVVSVNGYQGVVDIEADMWAAALAL